MGIMTSFSYTCIVWITICVDLLSAEDMITVSGHVGSTAVLPCKLPNVDTKETPYIRWKINSETVFERLGKESYQIEGYKDRVDIPEDELHKGNCSLVLRNLTLNDADVYTSYQLVTRIEGSVQPEANPISRVKLTITEKPTGPLVPTTEATEATDKSEGGSSAPVGIIVLGVILVILLILLVAVIVYWYLKKQKNGAVVSSYDAANTVKSGDEF